MPAYDMSGEMDHSLAHIAGRMQPRPCPRCAVLLKENAALDEEVRRLRMELGYWESLYEVDTLMQGFDETG